MIPVAENIFCSELLLHRAANFVWAAALQPSSEMNTIILGFGVIPAREPAPKKIPMNDIMNDKGHLMAAKGKKRHIEPACNM